MTPRHRPAPSESVRPPSAGRPPPGLPIPARAALASVMAATAGWIALVPARAPAPSWVEPGVYAAYPRASRVSFTLREAAPPPASGVVGVSLVVRGSRRFAAGRRQLLVAPPRRARRGLTDAAPQRLLELSLPWPTPPTAARGAASAEQGATVGDLRIECADGGRLAGRAGVMAVLRAPGPAGGLRPTQSWSSSQRGLLLAVALVDRGPDAVTLTGLRYGPDRATTGRLLVAVGSEDEVATWKETLARSLPLRARATMADFGRMPAPDGTSWARADRLHLVLRPGSAVLLALTLGSFRLPATDTPVIVRPVLSFDERGRARGLGLPQPAVNVGPVGPRTTPRGGVLQRLAVALRSPEPQRCGV